MKLNLGVQIFETVSINGEEYIKLEDLPAIADVVYGDHICKTLRQALSDMKVVSDVKSGKIEVVNVANAQEEKEVVKRPWRPKRGEKYWTYRWNTKSVCRRIWLNAPIDDMLRFEKGLVFRTKEEAIKDGPKIYKKLIGDESRKESEYE